MNLSARGLTNGVPALASLAVASISSHPWLQHVVEVRTVNISLASHPFRSLLLVHLVAHAVLAAIVIGCYFVISTVWTTIPRIRSLEVLGAVLTSSLVFREVVLYLNLAAQSVMVSVTTLGVFGFLCSAMAAFCSARRCFNVLK